MRRRDFIALFAGTAAAWPLAARGEQPAVPVVGFLHGSTSKAFARNVAGFLQGLKETGYVDGENVAIEYRWAEGHYERLADMAADLVRRGVAVITANTTAAPAAKAATATIPIVFVSGNDPVVEGLVKSMNRPGGNITGVSIVSYVLVAKQLDILRELVPAATSFAFLYNPANPNAQSGLSYAQAAARQLGAQLHLLNGSSEAEIDAAFAALRQMKVAALAVVPDSFLISRRSQIVTLAARQGIPTMYQFRDFVDAGGLMSYGPSLADAYRLAGTYVGRILKGEKPADLPVQEPTTFELVINLTTAKVLGLTVPDKLLATADEVIE